MTRAQNARALQIFPSLDINRLLSAVVVSLIMLTLTALGASPARAEHPEAIYCEGHGGAYGQAHYRHHDDGYILGAPGAYRFYPRSGYATLAADFYGAPAVYVSGGYFYPLQIGYGPIYEPTGYFALHAGRYGRTTLGLQIGIGALPTIGFGYLAYQPHVAHYRAPGWHYFGNYVRYPAAPHIHRFARHHRDRHLRHGGHDHSAKLRLGPAARHDRGHAKWQKAVRHELKHRDRVHDEGRPPRRSRDDAREHPRRKVQR